jgi:hypothetical protein
MLNVVKVAVCSQINTKHIKPQKTERSALYLKTLSI